MRNFIRKASPLFRVDLLILLFLFLEHPFSLNLETDCKKQGVNNTFAKCRISNKCQTTKAEQLPMCNILQKEMASLSHF